MPTLAPSPLFTATKTVGLMGANLKIPLAGGKLWSYAAGTTTPKDTFTGDSLLVANTNPVILNSRGEANVWLGLGAYKFLLTDSDDVTQPGWPIDDIRSTDQLIADAEAYTDTLRADLASPDGSTNVGFLAAGGGAVERDMQDKARDLQSVKDRGALGDGAADDYPAFAAAVAALPAAGGTIIVPDGIYRIETDVAFGAKSINWDIAAGATFTGVGTGEGNFPYMSSNVAQLAVGPYIRSQSMAHSTNSNGGIAAFNVEMIQPLTYGAGQSVAIYTGAIGSCADVSANVWAINALVRAESTALGTYQAIEVDVDCFSASALMKGISISGAGPENPDVALEIVRAAGKWDRGVHVLNAQDAIVVNNIPGGRGLVMGNPLGIIEQAIAVKQFANGSTTMFIQRNEDAAPTGEFLRFVNYANTSNLVIIDVLGNIITKGIVTGFNLRATDPALPTAVNELSLGTVTSVSASAGANGAVPAQVAAYLDFYHGANHYKIPFFNA